MSAYARIFGGGPFDKFLAQASYGGHRTLGGRHDLLRA